jgi:hypothetical protein
MVESTNLRVMPKTSSQMLSRTSDVVTGAADA